MKAVFHTIFLGLADLFYLFVFWFFLMKCNEELHGEAEVSAIILASAEF